MEHDNLTKVGSELIHGVRVPVYTVKGRAGRWCFQEDEWGKRYLISVEGAKLFKQGPLPMDATISTILEAEMNAEGTPFILRDPNSQKRSANNIIRTLLDRAGISTPSAILSA